MPELPEVETIRRQLDPRVRGRTVQCADGHPSAKFSQAAAATGATISGIGRRGKYLLWALDDGHELVVHLGMTGALRIRRTSDPPACAGADPYLRAWWELDDGDTVELHDVRRFGRVAVVPAGDHATLPTLHRLGPEPFDPAFDPMWLYRSLRASVVRVKTQLLAQRVVAGVGNIYADEALWRAEVHPGTRRVTRAQACRLHAALRQILAAGIAHGGTLLRDYRTLDGATGTNQLRLSCYGRAGQPCARCATALRRAVIDARGTTWCPQCQRR